MQIPVTLARFSINFWMSKSSDLIPCSKWATMTWLAIKFLPIEVGGMQIRW